MNNKEKPQGLSVADREIQIWVSTKQKEHLGLTGLKVKLPAPAYWQEGGASSRLACEGFQVRKNKVLIPGNRSVEKGE